MKNKALLCLLTMSIGIFAITPASAATKKITLENNGITWTYPSSFKLKSAGCSFFDVGLVWNAKTSDFTVAAFDIEDADGGLIATNSVSRTDTGKAGTLKLKVCREDYSYNGTQYSGAKKGTNYTTGRINDFQRKVIADQVDGTIKFN